MSDFVIIVNVLVVIFAGYELNNILNNLFEINYWSVAFFGYLLGDSLKELLVATLKMLGVEVDITNADK